MHGAEEHERLRSIDRSLPAKTHQIAEAAPSQVLRPAFPRLENLDFEANQLRGFMDGPSGIAAVEGGEGVGRLPGS